MGSTVGVLDAEGVGVEVGAGVEVRPGGVAVGEAVIVIVGVAVGVGVAPSLPRSITVADTTTDPAPFVAVTS